MILTSHVPVYTQFLINLHSISRISSKAKEEVSRLMEEGDNRKTAPAAMEADEEEKMEKFYALVSNLKALRGGVCKSELAPRKRMRSESLLWKPTFRWEDFAGGSDGLCSTARYEECGRKKRRKEVEGGGEVESVFDLKLGL
ncbi:NRR repressor homolog 1-like [Phalaenopsis equestris]|uniref:NRR repressor homolog 1-like n=1 Tax=Phalaenopsis equestris TaxID=78828 RepID=UPI0009E27B35|nr:NRR repressor homolog 1-like [Phalaenopsis equestris]